MLVFKFNMYSFCAVAYTPIPYKAEHILREVREDRFVEMDSKFAEHSEGVAAPSPDHARANMASLMQNQIFLGMVGSRIPLKPSMRNHVEEAMAARIRFVFFSPRNMRRSKALAEKLGLETDWNCAVRTSYYFFS